MLLLFKHWKLLFKSKYQTVLKYCTLCFFFFFCSASQRGLYHLPFIACHLPLTTCVEAKLYTFNSLSFTVNNFSIMKNCVKAELVLEFTWRRTEWPWATKFSQREREEKKKTKKVCCYRDSNMTRVMWSIGQLSWTKRVRGLDPPLLHFWQWGLKINLGESDLAGSWYHYFILLSCV